MKRIYCYLCRCVRQHETAEDLTQEFFREFFVEGRLLKAADQELGGFRPLLTTALRHPDGYVAGAAFSPDGRQIVTCGGNGSVVLWDTSRLKKQVAGSDE